MVRAGVAPLLSISTPPDPAPPTAATTATGAVGATSVAPQSVAATAASAAARVASAVVRAVVAPLLSFGSGPGAPVESPGLWVLAAAARRQIGQADTEDAQVSAAASTGELFTHDTDGELPAARTVAALVANTAPAITAATAGAPNSSTGVVAGTVIASDTDNGHAGLRGDDDG